MGVPPKLAAKAIQPLFHIASCTKNTAVSRLLQDREIFSRPTLEESMIKRLHKKGQSPPMGEGFPFVDSGASPPGYRPVEENSRDSLLPKNILDIQANVNREAVKRIPGSLTKHEPDKILFPEAIEKDICIEKPGGHLHTRISSKLANSLARTLENLK